MTIAERSTHMLARAGDERASEMLRSYFESVGIGVRADPVATG